MDNVVNYYENYREEDRLSTNNARKIEFVTTTKMLDTLFDNKSAILESKVQSMIQFSDCLAA